MIIEITKKSKIQGMRVTAKKVKRTSYRQRGCKCEYVFSITRKQAEPLREKLGLATFSNEFFVCACTAKVIQ